MFELQQEIIDIGDNVECRVRVCCGKTSTNECIYKRFLQLGSVESLRFSWGRHFLDETAKAFGFKRGVANIEHNAVSNTSVYHLYRVVDDIINRMNYVRTAASGLAAGSSFVNVADAGGVYNGQWVQAVTRWVTTVYGKPAKLPRTGY